MIFHELYIVITTDSECKSLSLAFKTIEKKLKWVWLLASENHILPYQYCNKSHLSQKLLQKERKKQFG